MTSNIAAPGEALTGLQLSLRYIAAYNMRDAEGIGVMLDPDVVQIRPRGLVLKGSDAVLARYEDSWRKNDFRILTRRTWEKETITLVEISVAAPEIAPYDAVVIHEWSGQRLVMYRLYEDS